MLQGIFPVIPTLFTDADEIDAEAVCSVVRFALDAGAHGIVFPGVASEYNFLTVDERNSLMTAVHDEVAGRVPIIGGASAPTSEEVITVGQNAIDHGIEHLMIMAPNRLGDDVSAHQAFFADVSRGLPQAEILLQNAPSPIGAGLDADSIIAIATSNPAITYVKEETLPSGPTITKVIESKVPHLKAMFGGGGARFIVDELARGAMAALPAVELTDLHVAIYNAFVEGDQTHARHLYRLSLPLLLCQSIYRMRLTKYVLKLRGVADRQRVRAALPEMDAHTQRDIDAMWEQLRSDFA